LTYSTAFACCLLNVLSSFPIFQRLFIFHGCICIIAPVRNNQYSRQSCNRKDRYRDNTSDFRNLIVKIGRVITKYCNGVGRIPSSDSGNPGFKPWACYHLSWQRIRDFPHWLKEKAGIVQKIRFLPYRIQFIV